MFDSTEQILQMMDTEYFPVPHFIHTSEFLSSKVFKRYIEKCNKLLTEFLCNCLTSTDTNDYSETTFRRIFLASYFHLLREGHTHEFIGELALDSCYPHLQGVIDYKQSISNMYVDLADIEAHLSHYAEENVPEALLYVTQQLTKKQMDDILDHELASALNETIFQDYDYGIYDLVSYSFVIACKMWLEKECMAKNLKETQINFQAMPESLVDRYQLYTQTLSIFHSNLMTHFLENSQDRRVNNKLKNARKKHKEKVKELTSNNKSLQKELSALQVENQKHKNNDSQKITSQNNDKLVASLQDEILELKRKLSKADKEIEYLTSKNEFLEAQLAVDDETTVTIDAEIECDYTKKYAFVCQHETLSSKIKQAFPNSIIITKPISTSLAKLKIDSVVLITSEMSHSLYGVIKQNAVASNIPYIHCKEINIDRIAQCIATASQ